MPRISETFRRLVKNNVGLLNVEMQKLHHQVFWVATWDHFIGGDSEVHIIAQARGGYPPTLDNVCVDIPRWDQIKDTLGPSERSGRATASYRQRPLSPSMRI